MRKELGSNKSPVAARLRDEGKLGQHVCQKIAHTGQDRRGRVRRVCPNCPQEPLEGSLAARSHKRKVIKGLAEKGAEVLYRDVGTHLGRTTEIGTRTLVDHDAQAIAGSGSLEPGAQLVGLDGTR